MSIKPTITYTVRITTSEEYNLTGIEIEDILPDGVNYVGNIITSEELGLVLFNNVEDPVTGKKILTWRITNATGVVAGNEYLFTYEVLVDNEYEVKELKDGDNRLFSSDYLSSNLTLRGLWGDIDEAVVRSAIEEDRTYTHAHLPYVSYEEGIKRTDQIDYFQEIDVKIGDVLDVSLEVDFPENTPTNGFEYRYYLPVGTELLGDIQISYLGDFELSPVTAESIKGGYLLYLGKIEPGTTLLIEYSLNVLDDPNLKLAVKTRNLVRSQYLNINGTKTEYKDQLTLNLIEPQLVATKSILSGYIARGEVATLRTKVENIGTDTAYGITFSDSIPLNTIFEVGTDSVSGVPVTYSLVNDEFLIDSFDLASGESVTLEYSVLGDLDLLWGDDVSSRIIISEFSNRDELDPLPARIYESQQYDFNWRAKEPLLVTDIVRPGVNSDPDILIGRTDTFSVEATTKSVGGSPVYSANITVDISGIQAIDPAVTHQSFIITSGNSVEIFPDSIVGGILEFSGIDFGASSIFKITVDGQSSFDVVFGDLYNVNIQVVAEDAIGDPIRLDGSQEASADIDDDDQTSKQIVITKLDLIEPTGQIEFKEGAEVVTFTQADNIDVVYTATDGINPTEVNHYIVGVQFSNDGINWSTTLGLPVLGAVEKNILEIIGEWNEWDGSEVIVNTSLASEGSTSKYMQIVDSYGNIALIENQIIKDTTPPIFAYLNISPFEGDITNPEFTGIFSNYLVFYGEDSQLNGAPSGLGEYSYSFDNITWTDWASMSDGTNSILLDFPIVADGENLEILLKVRDLAGNEMAASLFDDITYVEDEIQIEFTINDGDEYTNTQLVDILLNMVLESDFPLHQIRFGKDAAALQASEWEVYGTLEFQRVLFEGWEDGEKNLCIQVRDTIANQSNITCQTILLDTVPPDAMLLVPDTTSRNNVSIAIDSTDPDLPDLNPGSGNIMMRFSSVGEDCELLIDEDEKAACELNWDTWESFAPNKDWLLDNYVGAHQIYVQFKDGAGNTTPVSTYQVDYHPVSSGRSHVEENAVSLDGSMVINNDELFTNTRHVMLNFNMDLSNIECDGCTDPLLMRFYQVIGDETPPVPPIVHNAEDDSNGWTYWQEYYDPKEWNLDADNEGSPNYGEKKVYVQFMLPNAEVTDLYYDSILYAPHYAIEYTSIDNVASTYLAQENFQIKLDAKNIGSFTWPMQGDNPVHITYKWVWTGGTLPEGWTEETIQKEIRGSASVLAKNIHWDQETGEVELNINTPYIPGNYKLVIDTVHEGKAWFGDFANPTPTYQVAILENPDKPTPIPDFGDVLGVNTAMGAEVAIPYEWEADGWGANCADTWSNNHNRTCYISGTWNTNRDTRYKSVCASVGGYYKYEIVTDGRKFNFCPSDTNYWNQFLGQEMVSQVTYRADGVRFWINRTEPIRRYWKSELKIEDNDPKLFDVIEVNKSTATTPYEFTIQPKFRNTGNGIWQRGQVYLVSVDKNGNEVNSPFAGSDWKSSSRMYLAPNSSGWGQWSRAPFTGKIHIPENISWGIHEQCFQVRRDGVGFERSDVMCIKLDIQMDYEEEREYYCPQPHPVYEQMNIDADIIGYINEGDGFVIKGEEVDWSLIYFPEGDYEEGWIENNLECFSESEIIENIIPKPEFDITDPPEGDEGIVITIGTIDVKNGPGEGFDTIATINEGDKVQVLAEAYIEGDKYGGWLLVRLEDGTEGWVPKGSIWHTNDPQDIEVNIIPEYAHGHVCGDDDIPVYPMPGVSTKIGTLKPDQNVPIIRTWNGWYQVYTDRDGSTGWIDSMAGLCNGYSYPKENFCGSGEVGYPYENEVPYSPTWGGFRSGNRPEHSGIDLGASFGMPILAATSGSVLGYSRWISKICKNQKF